MKITKIIFLFATMFTGITLTSDLIERGLNDLKEASEIIDSLESSTLEASDGDKKQDKDNATFTVTATLKYSANDKTYTITDYNTQAIYLAIGDENISKISTVIETNLLKILFELELQNTKEPFMSGMCVDVISCKPTNITPTKDASCTIM